MPLGESDRLVNADVRYLLPPLIFLPLLDLSKLRLRSHKTLSAQPSATQPSTADTLLITLSDLHSIHALLPPSPIPTISSMYDRFSQLGLRRLIRGLLIIWITWIILGRVIGYRSLLALAGTVFLLLPSPPLAHLVNILNKSLAVRRGAALAFLFTFGSPPDHSYPISLHFSPLGWAKSKWATSRRPSLAFSFKPNGSRAHQNDSTIDDDEEHQSEKVGNPIYFRFEVHENQRWWMGLDWTSALLPQERPSWCDSHLLPVLPPQSFPLPSAASIILPAPTRADKHARVKRTAVWRWLDDDWSVVRAGTSAPVLPVAAASSSEPETDVFSPGHQPSRSLSISTALGNSPPNNHSSTLEDNVSAGTRAQSIAEQAFTKGLERLKARTNSPVIMQSKSVTTASPKVSSEMSRARTGSHSSEDMQQAEGTAMPVETIVDRDDVSVFLGQICKLTEQATDADGWVYGDNKWENTGARGGLGKVTSHICRSSSR